MILDSVLPGVGNDVGGLLSITSLPLDGSETNDVGTTRAVVVVGKLVFGEMVVVEVEVVVVVVATVVLELLGETVVLSTETDRDIIRHKRRRHRRMIRDELNARNVQTRRTLILNVIMAHKMSIRF